MTYDNQSNYHDLKTQLDGVLQLNRTYELNQPDISIIITGQLDDFIGLISRITDITLPNKVETNHDIRTKS